MTLESYFTYVRADLRATRKAWLLGLASFVALLVANHLLALTDTDYEPVFYFALVFAACAPGIAYRRLIWVAPSKKSSRTPRVFWLSFFRTLPGSVPAMLFIVWGATHFNLPVTIASRFKGYPIIPRSAHFSEYVLCLAIAVVFLVYSELFSAAIGIVEQGHLQTKNRRQRALNHLISMGLFGAAMTLATGLSSLLFCLYYDLSVGDLTWTIVVLSVPATAALFAWTYRAWAASD